MNKLTMDEQVKIAAERREARNVRDRLARKILQEHPEIKDDPDDAVIESSWIYEGTTEAAVRSLARHYYKQKMIRQLVNERKKIGDL